MKEINYIKEVLTYLLTEIESHGKIEKYNSIYCISHDYGKYRYEYHGTVHDELVEYLYIYNKKTNICDCICKFENGIYISDKKEFLDIAKDYTSHKLNEKLEKELDKKNYYNTKKNKL